MSYEEDRVAFNTARYHFGFSPNNDLVRLEPDQTYWNLYSVVENCLVGTVAPSKFDRSMFIATLLCQLDTRISDVNPLKAATNAWKEHLERKAAEKRGLEKSKWTVQIMSYNRADGVNIGRSERDYTKWHLFDHDGTSYSFVAREFHPNYGVLLDDLEGPLWTSFETAMETLKTVESVATEPYERI